MMYKAWENLIGTYQDIFRGFSELQIKSSNTLSTNMLSDMNNVYRIIDASNVI